MNFLTFLVLVALVGYVSCEGKCLLRGACVQSTAHGKKVPCVEENDPIEFEGDDLALYQKLCPHLAKDKLACCDRKQLKDLEADYNLVSDFGSYCGGNHMEIFCQINCSPGQSSFMQVLEKYKAWNDEDEDDEEEDKPKEDKPKKERQYVIKASVAMEFRDALKFYRGCQWRYSYKLNKHYYDLFRDPQKASHALYRIQDELSPFEIDFHLHHSGKAFHVQRNRETAELVEEFTPVLKDPIELNIED